MSVAVDPSKNLGHASWSLTSAPPGEVDTADKVFWCCDRCGFVVGFWRDGYGSTPTADENAPAENVGAYTGQFCV